MPKNPGKSRPRSGRVQVSELHKKEQFGELQGELRENADDVGFQEQMHLENAPGRDQHHPEPGRQEEERRRYDRLQHNRPGPTLADGRDRD